jgi:hypothetical protein
MLFQPRLAFTLTEKPMKRVLAILAVAVAHAVISFGLLLYVFSAGVERYDLGTGASSGQRLVEIVSNVLLAPIFYPGVIWAPRAFRGPLGFIPLVANSLLWALGISSLWQYFRRSKTRAAGERTL